MKRRKEPPASLPRCVLDSGGLSALVGGSHRARERLRWLLDRGGKIRIPLPVLVACVTGDSRRDAEINRVLGVLERAHAVFEAIDESTARTAGRLRFAARSDDGIDALVAASAVGDGSPAIVLTSDPRDLEKLLVREPHVVVRKV